MPGKKAAKVFSYGGALGTAACAAPLAHGLFTRTGDWTAVLPQVIALILGAAGFITANRTVAVVISAFIISTRLWDAGAGSVFSWPLDAFIFMGIGVGLIGVFELQRQKKLSHGDKNPNLFDIGTATSFIRISGAAGLSFGPLLWMFSMSEISGLTALDSTTGVLVTLFAWQTLKRQPWGAAAQMVLSIGTLAVAQNNPTGAMSAFGFFPLFLTLIYPLGFIGTMKLRKNRRHGDNIT
jgi:hypothetical protein